MQTKHAERRAPLGPLKQVLALVVVTALRTLHLLLIIINLAAHMRVCIGVRAWRHALVGQLLVVLRGKQGDQGQPEVATSAERNFAYGPPRLPLGNAAPSQRTGWLASVGPP